MLDQHGKFIPAQPGDRIAAPGGVQEPMGQRGEELITEAVSETVVHGLELVRVEEEDRDASAGPFGASERVLDAVVEEHAVG